MKTPHIRRARAGGDFPVDKARVIPGLVLAEVIKLQPLATETGAVLAGERGCGEPARRQLNAAHFLHDFLRFIHGGCVSGVHHGTGTLERMLSMMLSLVMLAASAS